MSLPKTSRALKITMEPHRRHDAATDSCCCSGIHAGRRRRASSGANFAQFWSSPARTRYAISIAFEMCAAHLQRAAHDLSQSSAGWTVEPRSVPNRVPEKNRWIFSVHSHLRVDPPAPTSPSESARRPSTGLTRVETTVRSAREP